MNISSKGLVLIKSFEGLRTKAYKDSAGVWTIAYGATRYPDGTRVKEHDECTVEEAEEFLEHDVNRFVAALNRRVSGIHLSQAQFDALVSFCFNLGMSAFDSSTLYKKLRINPNDETIWQYDEELPEMSCEFTKWIRSGGNIVKGLLIRRMIEADFYHS